MAEMTKKTMFMVMGKFLAGECELADDVRADMIEFCKKEEALLDKRAEQAKARRAKGQKERDEFAKMILADILPHAEDGLTATEIGLALGLSTQKVTPILTFLRDEELIKHANCKGKVKKFVLV